MKSSEITVCGIFVRGSKYKICISEKKRGFPRCAALFLAESQKRARPKAGWGWPRPGTQKFLKNHEKSCWSMSMVPDRSVPGPVKKSPQPPGRPVRDPADPAELIRFPNEKSLENTFFRIFVRGPKYKFCIFEKNADFRGARHFFSQSRRKVPGPR